MNIYIGADHRGFAMKGLLVAELKNEGYTVIDVGAATLVKDDDYPDFARGVAENVAQDPEGRRGIVICGSGFGADIAANKVRGIRAALAMSPDHIYQGRHDDDVNVLALAADFVNAEDAGKMVKVFLTTPFAKEERYARRLKKVAEMEGGI
ncbi:MAG: RpiB/LacA/LacB family sugar-phosphate isomerase [Candidatus Pacebacteria bacterium]|nr:RpiB/LacA/LacB family sugar-phosphate isomerase [Candidatus Paceibacterota bacterium]